MASPSRTHEGETLKELLKQRPRIQKKQPKSDNTCWNREDLKKLERCISILGTDFDLIQLLFKNRTRKQIMNKYKKAKIQYDRKHSDRFQRIQAELQKDQQIQRERLGSIDSIDLVSNVYKKNIALDIHDLSKQNI